MTNQVEAAVNAAPELNQSPGAAVTVASNGGNITQNAQVVAQAGQNAQNAQAAQRANASGGGILHDVLGFLGHDVVHPLVHAVGDLANASWMPTQFVQHEYRYLRNVQETHGDFAAIAEGLGIAAGAAGGFALGGFGGAMLGGEAVGGLEGQVLYKDAWHATGQAGYVDPRTGKAVSFGRDIASGLMHLHQGSGAYSFLSGALDGIFDLVADPLSEAGDLVKGARSAEGAKGLLGERFSGLSVGSQAKRVLGAAADTGRDVPNLTAEAVERAYGQYGSFRNAVASIAKMDPAQIIRAYPKLAPLADDLGKAQNADEVMDVFKDASKAGEYLSNKLPSLSIGTAGFKRVRMLIENADTLKGGALNPLNAPKIINKALTRIPGEALDPVTHEFDGRTLDPTSLRDVRDFRNFLSYALNGKQLDTVLNAYVNADVAGRVRIFRNSVLDVLLRKAGVDYGPKLLAGGEGSIEAVHEQLNDPALRAKIKDFLDAAAPFKPEINGRYMTTLDGGPGSLVVDPDTGTRFSAGVFLSDRGKLTIPEFSETTRMAQEISHAKFSRLLGGADDFLYEHVTNRFFKRWVLLSGGYAEHMGLSEMIPTVLRNGVSATAKSAMAKVARLGYVADHGEMPKFEGFVYRLLQKTPKKMLDDHTMERAAEFYVGTEGNVASKAISADHTYGGIDDPENALRHGAEKATMKPHDSQYTGYGPESEQHLPNWQIYLRKLSKDAAAKAAAKAYLGAKDLTEAEADRVAQKAARDAIDKYTAAERESMLRSQIGSDGAPDGLSKLDDWAHQVAEGVKGGTFSPTTRQPNEALLRAVANGDTRIFNQRHLRSIAEADRPLKVPGRLLVPAAKHLPEEIANFGYNKVINPIINFMSRQPVAFQEYVKARDLLQPLVDGGVYSEDQAFTIAMARSTAESARFVHNIHDRTQLDQLLRNVAPFFFAQEQAYRRAGRLLVESPGAFRRYQLMISQVHNVVNKMNDSNGSPYISFPGLGWLGHDVPGMFGKLGIPVASLSPVGFGGTMSSANVIFPLSDGVRPNLGPVAMIPAQLMQGIFTELGKKYSDFAPVTNAAQGALSWAVGTDNLSQPILEQFIPNETVYRMVQAISGDDTQFNNAMVDTMQALAYQQAQAMDTWIKGGMQGKAPDNILPGYLSPQNLQQLQDSNSPAAQQVLQQVASAQNPLQQQSFVNKVRNQTRILFVTRAIIGAGSPLSADVMVNNYGMPQALSDAITKAGNVTEGINTFLAANPDATPYTTFQSTTTSGITMPESQQAMDWVTANAANIQQNPAYIWLMPQVSSQYSEQAYNEQIAEGYRQKYTPDQFLQQLYINAGNAAYYDALPQHEAAVNAAQGSTSALSQEYARWQSYVNMLATQMPVWADNFNSNSKLSQAHQYISQLNTIYDNNQEGDSEQAQLVGQLLQAYNSYSQQYQTASTASNYDTQEKQVADQWTQYLAGVAQQYPQLQAVINGVFKNALISTSTIAG